MSRTKTTIGQLKNNYNAGIGKWTSTFKRAMETPSFSTTPKKSLGTTLKPLNIKLPNLPTLPK